MASETGRPSRRGFSALGPAILIGLGIIFLLNTLDILPWSVWGSLWRFWPIILILIGIEILLGRTGAGWGVSLLISLALVALLVGAAVLLALLGVRRDRAWLRREGVLLTLGVAPLAGYALIHVEGRYVAGPIVVLGVALLGLLRPAGAEGRRLIGAVCACVIPLQLVPLAVDTAYHAAWVAWRPAAERAKGRGDYRQGILT